MAKEDFRAAETPTPEAKVAPEEPPSPKILLRRRPEDPATAVPAPPAPPLVNHAAVGRAELAANQRSRRAALEIGAAVLVVFVIAGYLVYKNLPVKTKADAVEAGATPRAGKLVDKSDQPAPAAADAAKTGTVAVTIDAPSPAFRAWVANLRINGVRAGANPRLLAANRLYSVGEIMNAELEITFDGYDAQRRLVRFREKSGFTLERQDR